jgi:hypothetical protein
MIITYGQAIAFNENPDITYMTIVTDNVPRSQPKEFSLLQELAISFVLLALLTAGIALAITATVLPGILLFFPIIIIAIPYTLVATIFAVRNRKRAKQNVLLALNDGYTVLDEYKDIANFKTRWQRWTLSFNIILALAYIPLMLGALEGDFAEGMLIGGSIAEVAAIFMIILNRHFIYNKRAIEAEAYGLTTKTTASKFIRVNRTWSWITWYAYCIVPVILLFTF